MRRALITGINGQDGFFLKELLLKKGYQVFGFARKTSQSSIRESSEPLGNVQMLYGDIANEADISAAVDLSRPDEIYHLASQSRPGQSWTQVHQTLNANGMGTIHLLEALRRLCPESRCYHASSSEMFGHTTMSPQNEETPFNPSNPYAASKVFSHQMMRIYRESYGLFIVNGILFNHESERRPLHFLTQKIAYGAACAKLGINNSPEVNERGLALVSQGKLALGNLNVARDWGYAPDFVHAMWLMLQHDKPEDFVIGTGRLHTLAEICAIAYQHVDKDWQEHVISDPALIRPLETSPTVADTSKARRLLNWWPSVNFEDMIKKMVDVQVTRLSSAFI
ncbi:GDP-mannose 4,6-dehydratase [Legionella parisiensis]|uniref:GDP-mannose 4,6-dehydratase n=1 Tax=Legionella parisiensis TaxID=45071 RepID=A0A1E5JL51_9GAMM|nr:GDP-mannose 4,6-dehydratase [Legionella parisiensis]KTD41679.1 GDP-mannose 4,6-dehydratase [Legionella parisiensis]OEH45277.1 GDP-mannose 4,6-dehydratase [Legionella parisiensis]STX75999.1 GDP-D-mannose dehydratase, NAD(P)-binding [Legionella parisiensis]